MTRCKISVISDLNKQVGARIKDLPMILLITLFPKKTREGENAERKFWQNSSHVPNMEKGLEKKVADNLVEDNTARSSTMLCVGQSS